MSSLNAFIEEKLITDPYPNNDEFVMKSHLFKLINKYLIKELINTTVLMDDYLRNLNIIAKIAILDKEINDEERIILCNEFVSLLIGFISDFQNQEIRFVNDQSLTTPFVYNENNGIIYEIKYNVAYETELIAYLINLVNDCKLTKISNNKTYIYDVHIGYGKKMTS